MSTYPVLRRLRRSVVLCGAALFLAGAAGNPLCGATSPTDAALPLAEAAKATVRPAPTTEALFARCIDILTYGDALSSTKPGKSDAVTVLGVLGDERAVPTLVAHLQRSDSAVLRSQIVKALGWIGSAQAVPALEETLKDKAPFLRLQAANALRAITGKEYTFDRTGLHDPVKLMEEIRVRSTEAK